MQKWRQHDEMAACYNFQVVEDDLKLFCDVYIMLCRVSDPNLAGGGELIAFILNEQLTQVIHETSTVSRSDDVSCQTVCPYFGHCLFYYGSLWQHISRHIMQMLRRTVVYHVLIQSAHHNLFNNALVPMQARYLVI